jgi:hypothetical protein
MTNWRTKGFFNRPTGFNNSVINNIPSNTKVFRPSLYVLGLAVECDIVIVSAIVVLLRYCCPSHVSGFISKISIYAIQCMFFCWLWSNVVIKQRERRHPFLADLYSPAAVILEPFVVGICAAAFHAIPRFIFRSIGFVVFKIHGVTSWLKVVVEKVCWKAVNQLPLFGSYPIQHEVY